MHCGLSQTTFSGSAIMKTSLIETAAGVIYPESLALEKMRAAHQALVEEQKDVDADGNTAAAYASLQMWRSALFPGFPITPSTKWLETIAATINNKNLKNKKVKLLEAEHAVADYM